MNAPQKKLDTRLLSGPFVVAAVLCDGFDAASGSILGARLAIPAVPQVDRILCLIVAAGAWRKPFKLRVEYRGPNNEKSKLLGEEQMRFEHIGSFRFIPIALKPDPSEGLHWIRVSIGDRVVSRSPFLALAPAPPLPFPRRGRSESPARTKVSVRGRDEIRSP